MGQSLALSINLLSNKVTNLTVDERWGNIYN